MPPTHQYFIIVIKNLFVYLFDPSKHGYSFTVDNAHYRQNRASKRILDSLDVWTVEWLFVPQPHVIMHTRKQKSVCAGSQQIVLSLTSKQKDRLKICYQFIISQLLLCLFPLHCPFVTEWAFGQAGVTRLSALLKALLRWWWKALSNGITHRDKCPQPGGSALLPPAFWRMALIHSAVAFLRVLGMCIDYSLISPAVIFFSKWKKSTSVQKSFKVWFVNWNNPPFNLSSGLKLWCHDVILLLLI